MEGKKRRTHLSLSSFEKLKFRILKIPRMAKTFLVLTNIDLPE